MRWPIRPSAERVIVHVFQACASALGIAALLSACGGGGSADGSATNVAGQGQQAAVAAVSVTPTAVQSYWGYSVQLTATARDAAGSALSPTPALGWSSGDAAVATVDGSGRVDLLRPGSTTVTVAATGNPAATASTTVAVRGLERLARGIDNTMCALAEGRTRIFCWGSSGSPDARIVNTSTASSVLQPTPIAQGEIPVGATIAKVAIALHAACALTDAGQAYCWGLGDGGELGQGDAAHSATPKQVAQGAVPAGVRFVDIARASWTTCAVGDDGRLYCWGDQLRIPNPALSSTGYAYLPVATVLGAVPGAVRLTKVALSTNTGCALGSDGEAYCWAGSSRSPAHVGQGERPVGSAFTELQINADLPCALAADGEAYCWSGGNGGASGYRFGNGAAAFAQHATPVRVAAGARPAGVRLTALSVGSSATANCAVADDGQAYCWAKGYHGGLGDGDLTEHDALVPVRVQDGERPAGVAWQAINCATYTCSALASDGRLYDWGSNNDGLLSRDTTTVPQSAVPLRITRVVLP